MPCIIPANAACCIKTSKREQALWWVVAGTNQDRATLRSFQLQTTAHILQISEFQIRDGRPDFR